MSSIVFTVFYLLWNRLTQVSHRNSSHTVLTCPNYGNSMKQVIISQILSNKKVQLILKIIRPPELWRILIESFNFTLLQ